MPDASPTDDTSTASPDERAPPVKGTRTDGGRPRRVSDDAIIAAVETVLRETGDPVATTSEIEERVPLSRRGLSKRLKPLREQDDLESKEVGARGRVWWVPSESAGTETDHAPGASDDAEDGA